LFPPWYFCGDGSSPKLGKALRLLLSFWFLGPPPCGLFPKLFCWVTPCSLANSWNSITLAFGLALALELCCLGCFPWTFKVFSSTLSASIHLERSIFFSNSVLFSTFPTSLARASAWAAFSFSYSARVFFPNPSSSSSGTAGWVWVGVVVVSPEEASVVAAVGSGVTHDPSSVAAEELAPASSSVFAPHDPPELSTNGWTSLAFPTLNLPPPSLLVWGFLDCPFWECLSNSRPGFGPRPPLGCSCSNCCGFLRDCVSTGPSKSLPLFPLFWFGWGSFFFLFYEWFSFSFLCFPFCSGKFGAVLLFVFSRCGIGD